jgi:hypothetical protein
MDLQTLDLETVTLDFYERDKKLFFNPSRSIGNRQICRFILNNNVCNRVQLVCLNWQKVQTLLTFRHENIEKILEWKTNEHFLYFTTPLFTTKLATVWEQDLQFVKYNVQEMFLDFLNGLIFLKNKNFVHGSIHGNNLAYNGIHWYISGILNVEKTGEMVSGCYTASSLKSRRWLNNSKPIPSDDLWQLILMYVITYYGFNPFRSINKAQNCSKWSREISNDCLQNITHGLCQNITVTKIMSSYGIKLQEMLLSTTQSNSYEKFKNIILNNSDQNIIDLINSDNMCIICCARGKQVTFFPCKHTIACLACAEKLRKSSPKCPYCRQDVLHWTSV